MPLERHFCGNDTFASYTTLNQCRDTATTLCWQEDRLHSPSAWHAWEAEPELAIPNQTLSWWSAKAHSAQISAKTHCVLMDFRCLLHCSLISSIKMFKILFQDSQNQILFLHLFSAMEQTSAKLAAALRSLQRGDTATCASRGEEPSSLLHELKGWWLALLGKNHSNAQPTNNAVCSASLTVRTTQRWTKTWPFPEHPLAVILKPWACCAHQPQLARQRANQIDGALSPWPDQLEKSCLR